MKNLSFVLALVLIVIFFNIFKPLKINGAAMEPNYPHATRYLQNRLAYIFSEVKRGDVVVFRFTNNPTYKGIFRVIGLPGDKIKIENGIVYINGVLLDEPYLAKQKSTFELEPVEIKDENEGVGKVLQTQGKKVIENGVEIQVPDNFYFLMGDNREHSSDSRAYGFIKKEDIFGKIMLRYMWPQ